MTTISVLLIGCVLVGVIIYAEDLANKLARERIHRQEADDWAAESERHAAAMATECARLRDQVATLQMLYAERTRDLLAHNYRIIATNVAWKRRRQQ